MTTDLNVTEKKKLYLLLIGKAKKKRINLFFFT
jgi:hypothetical protein